MKNKRRVLWIVSGALAIFVIILASSCFFTLGEDECAVVQRFGRIQSMYVKEITPALQEQLDSDNNSIPVVVGTGLKFKLPFFDHPIKYPYKLISYETMTREVTTSDKRKLYFDNNAQWRIENPYRFYMAYNNIGGAKMRIDDILYSSMNVEVGMMVSHDLITNKALSSEMLDRLTDQVSAECSKFGVYMADIRIKRTDLPQENYNSIYNRMNTERNRIAAQYRSEGLEASSIKRSETDRQVISITSEAAKRAEVTKGEGDSEAARIYNEAYGKNPEFYEFYNMLETYRVTVGESSTLVIPLDSPFAKYLLGINGSAVPAGSVSPEVLPE